MRRSVGSLFGRQIAGGKYAPDKRLAASFDEQYAPEEKGQKW
jgi:hypothetical protein